MIRLQVPHEVINKETFDAVSNFIIPKQQLARRSITATCLSFKVVGYPVYLADKKYPRNQFMFNVCFVCYPWSRTVQFEAAVRKLSQFLVDLEKEKLYLSSETNVDELTQIFSQVFYELNERDECHIAVNGLLCPLTLVRTRIEPSTIADWSVPIFLLGGDPSSFQGKDYVDLTISQILPFIDGASHVMKIAKKAKVGPDLVKMAVRNLVYYGIVTLVPIFQLRNSYRATTDFVRLLEDAKISEKALAIANHGAPADKRVTFRQLYRFASDFRHGTTVQDLVIRYQELGDTFRENLPNLTQWLCMKGIIKRINAFPIYRPREEVTAAVQTTATAPAEAVKPVAYAHRTTLQGRKDLLSLFNGSRSFDEICCLTGTSPQDLEKIIAEEIDVSVFSR